MNPIILPRVMGWPSRLGKGAVEYTDFIPAGGKTPQTSILDMTVNNRMVRFQ